MLPVWLAQAIETDSDRIKMEQLYDEYEKLLYSVAFSYLHDSYRAEDAVHDTFIKTIDHLDSITDIKCPQTRAFLITIVKNICLNILASKSYTVEVYDTDAYGQLVIETVPDKYSSIDDEYFDRFEVLQIVDAIRQLPDIQQDTMILYAAHGYTMKEIAEIQGCSIDTVKKRIQRSRLKIRQILGESK